MLEAYAYADCSDVTRKVPPSLLTPAGVPVAQTTFGRQTRHGCG